MSVTATVLRSRLGSGFAIGQQPRQNTKPLPSSPRWPNYEPGQFYRRELPCLLGMLEHEPCAEIVIIDGYVWLGQGQAGLGAHLYAAIGGVVVGVAKTRFADATSALEVYRGSSRSPLFVSAAGMSAEEAAVRVAEMTGAYRVPTLLKQVDLLARSASPKNV